MDFGFTNDDAQFAAANAFRNAAVADGWSIEPTYPKHEPADSVATLKKDGYHLMIVSRTLDKKKWKYEAQVSLWGPGGLSVRAPAVYDFQTIVKQSRHCKNCGADDVETVRYSFAGRCCKSCLPSMREKHERPGWNN